MFIEDGSFTFANRVMSEAKALVNAGWGGAVVAPRYRCDAFNRSISDELRACYYPKPAAKSVLGHLAEHGLSLLCGTVSTLWVSVRQGVSVFHVCNPMDVL